MNARPWKVSKNAGEQVWRPMHAEADSKCAVLFKRVAAKNRAKSDKAIADAYRLERSRDWAELARQPVGAESL